jgi:chitin synthase
MISTILGPATILLMMAGAFNAVMRISLWQSYLLSIGPAACYLIICFLTKAQVRDKHYCIYTPAMEFV